MTMARLLPMILVGFCFALPSKAQTSDTNHYVTVGVFAKMDNATRLVDKVIQQGYPAKYALNSSDKLNYVYILITTNKRAAFAQAIKLRAETEYKDAWVYIGNLTGTTAESTPVVEEKAAPVKEEPIVEIKPVVVEEKPAVDSSAIKPVEKPTETPVVTKPTGKPFYFKLVNGADGTEVKSGEIHLQETSRANQYQAFKPGEIIYLEAPKNTRGAYIIITQVAGYSPVITGFNYKKPIGEKGTQEEAIIEISLTKAKKGDYIDFNNVKFFKNAAIFQAAAENELNGLVDLMKENPKYKIKVHGHVNGKFTREGFKRGEKSSFFDTNPAADITIKNMTAKELSIARAEAVRDYLISQGIEASRISIKGDGATIPLYAEGGSQGSLNDRIEIEFTKH